MHSYFVTVSCVLWNFKFNRGLPPDALIPPTLSEPLKSYTAICIQACGVRFQNVRFIGFWPIPAAFTACHYPNHRLDIVSAVSSSCQDENRQQKLSKQMHEVRHLGPVVQSWFSVNPGLKFNPLF